VTATQPGPRGTVPPRGHVVAVLRGGVQRSAVDHHEMPVFAGVGDQFDSRRPLQRLRNLSVAAGTLWGQRHSDLRELHMASIETRTHKSGTASSGERTAGSSTSYSATNLPRDSSRPMSRPLAARLEGGPELNSDVQSHGASDRPRFTWHGVTGRCARHLSTADIRRACALSLPRTPRW
jgi:hypothetical protein